MPTMGATGASPITVRNLAMAAAVAVMLGLSAGAARAQSPQDAQDGAPSTFVDREAGEQAAQPALTAPTDPAAAPVANEAVDATARAYGAYQRGYYLTAMDLALSRAQLGDPAAQTLVAELFAEGLGVPRNLETAAFWYRQGAEGGDTSAQFKYALMLLEGRHVPRDEAKSAELMAKAADAGNPFAQFNHAQRLVAAKPGTAGIEAALPYFEKAAEQGVPDAQYALAQILMNGVGIPDEKRARAREWMEKAARGGYDTAQLDYAIWLIDGLGGPKDYEAGFRWMQVAATHGNILAQNRLALLYVHAIGTRPDPVEAAKWYILSKRAGYDDRDLDDFYQGLTTEEQKAAIDAANRFRRQ
mgnify:FL=1